MRSALGQTAGVAEVGSRGRLALILHRRGAQVDDKRVVHVDDMTIQNYQCQTPDKTKSQP